MNNESKTASSLYRLDRFLPWLLALQVAYVLFMIVVCGAAAVALQFVPGGRAWFRVQDIIGTVPLIMLIPLPISFLGNLIGAISSLILFIRTPGSFDRFPGIGHVFNWLYVVATGWIYLLALILVSSNFMID
jgi:hypothetical protein